MEEANSESENSDLDDNFVLNANQGIAPMMSEEEYKKQFKEDEIVIPKYEKTEQEIKLEKQLEHTLKEYDSCEEEEEKEDEEWVDEEDYEEDEEESEEEQSKNQPRKKSEKVNEKELDQIVNSYLLENQDYRQIRRVFQKHEKEIDNQISEKKSKEPEKFDDLPEEEKESLKSNTWIYKLNRENHEINRK